MKRMTKAVSMLGAAAVALSLTACGGDSGSDYCDELESVNDEFSAAGDAMSDPEAMSDMVDSFQGIADAAPDDVKGDWDALVEAMSVMSEIDMTDPEAMSDPETMEKLEGLEDVQTNSDNIVQHAQDECDVDLGA